MAREKEPLPTPENNPFHYDAENDAYGSVMQFISRNKTIPEKIAQFSDDPEHLEKIDNLFRVMNEEGLTIDEETIYGEPNCQLYSLYLLKEKKISMEEFLTVNLHLQAILQFIESPVFPDTEPFKKIELLEFNIRSMDENKIREKIMNGFEGTVGPLKRPKPFCNKFGIKEKKKLTEKFDELSPLGKSVIEITIDVSKLLESDLGTLFFYSDIFATGLTCMEEGDTSLKLYIPSIHAMHHILDVANPDYPVHMAPIIGRINLLTLFQMHQRGFHPVNLFFPEVKFNVTNVHQSNPGPLATAIHDISHIAFGNRIKKNEFDFLYEYFLPFYGKHFDLTGDDIRNEEKLGKHGQLFQIIDLIWRGEDIQVAVQSMLGLEDDNTAFNLKQEINGDIWVKQYLSFLETLEKDKEMIAEKYDIDLDKLLGGPAFKKIMAERKAFIQRGLESKVQKPGM